MHGYHAQVVVCDVVEIRHFHACLAHEFRCIGIESNAPYSRDVISIPVYALSIKKLEEIMYKELVYKKMEI
jgi:hypothetical protein